MSTTRQEMVKETETTQREQHEHVIGAAEVS